MRFGKKNKKKTHRFLGRSLSESERTTFCSPPLIGPGEQLADIKINTVGDKRDIETYSISFLSFS